jgi:uncharacterized integral membrane protein
VAIKHSTPSEDKVRRNQLTRLLAILIIVCFVAGLVLTDHANYISPYSPTTNRFVYDNAAWVFIILQGIFAYVLKRLQHGVYWFKWLQLKQPALDERQRHVRHIVFERAYLLSLIVLFVSITIASIPLQYATTFHSPKGIVIWAACILNITLPSILASWRKDN